MTWLISYEVNHIGCWEERESDCVIVGEWYRVKSLLYVMMSVYFMRSHSNVHLFSRGRPCLHLLLYVNQFFVECTG